MGKLVRDKIPDIIGASGRHCDVRILPPHEYTSALFTKLLEEAQEVVEAKPGEMLEELADLYEVVDAVAKLHGFDAEAIRQFQASKRDKRGGFEGRVLLKSFEKASKSV